MIFFKVTASMLTLAGVAVNVAIPVKGLPAATAMSREVTNYSDMVKGAGGTSDLGFDTKKPEVGNKCTKKSKDSKSEEEITPVIPDQQEKVSGGDYEETKPEDNVAEEDATPTTPAQQGKGSESDYEEAKPESTISEEDPTPSTPAQSENVSGGDYGEVEPEKSITEEQTKPTTPAQPDKGSDSDYGKVKPGFKIDEMLSEVNKVRSEAGAGPLTINDKLMDAAQQHSDWQAKAKIMSHTGDKGSSMSDRLEAASYSGGAMAENVAMGQRTVSEVMEGWMNSPGHRANLLNPAYTEFGAGMADFYWTQNFGRSLADGYY